MDYEQEIKEAVSEAGTLKDCSVSETEHGELTLDVSIDTSKDSTEVSKEDKGIFVPIEDVRKMLLSIDLMERIEAKPEAFDFSNGFPHIIHKDLINDQEIRSEVDGLAMEYMFKSLGISNEAYEKLRSAKDNETILKSLVTELMEGGDYAAVCTDDEKKTIVAVGDRNRLGSLIEPVFLEVYYSFASVFHDGKCMAMEPVASFEDGFETILVDVDTGKKFNKGIILRIPIIDKPKTMEIIPVIFCTETGRCMVVGKTLKPKKKDENWLENTLSSLYYEHLSDAIGMCMSATEEEYSETELGKVFRKCLKKAHVPSSEADAYLAKDYRFVIDCAYMILAIADQQEGMKRRKAMESAYHIICHDILCRLCHQEIEEDE